jgi:hypothetical protein
MTVCIYIIYSSMLCTICKSRTSCVFRNFFHPFCIWRPDVCVRVYHVPCRAQWNVTIIRQREAAYICLYARIPLFNTPRVARTRRQTRLNDWTWRRARSKNYRAIYDTIYYYIAGTYTVCNTITQKSLSHSLSLTLSLAAKVHKRV